MAKHNKMTHYCSPLRYPGGKNCIYKFIAELFYESKLIGYSYAEPYAGGAGVALRLLFNEFVDKIYINDFDYSIFSFWKTVIDNPNELCDWINNVPVSMDSWHEAKEVQRTANRLTDRFELAKAVFFLNRTNVSGVIKGGVIGGYNQTGKYKLDARFNKEDLINRIQRISLFKDRIKVSNNDGISFVNKLNKEKKDIFIYLDPPYYQKGADLYMNFYSAKDHEKLAKEIKRLKKRWMVSYDNNEFILNLYAEAKKIQYNLSQSASNRVGSEILVFCNDLSYNNAINQLKNPIHLPH